MEGRSEGDVCNRDGCKGIMILKPVENCTCHLRAPCGRCEENPAVCPECHEEAE